MLQPVLPMTSSGCTSLLLSLLTFSSASLRVFEDCCLRDGVCCFFCALCLRSSSSNLCSAHVSISVSSPTSFTVSAVARASAMSFKSSARFSSMFVFVAVVALMGIGVIDTRCSISSKTWFKSLCKSANSSIAVVLCYSF